MATISSAGVGSGLDVASIVSRLMSIENQSMTALNTKQSSYNTQLSAFGSIKSALSSLQTAAKALATPANFSSFKASVADADVMSVSANSSAVGGIYDVEVQGLALAQQNASGSAYNASTDVVASSAGTLTVTIGSSSVDVAVSAGSTLSNLRDAINSAGAGISATIITGKIAGIDKAQLFLTSTKTGSDGSFSLSNADGNLATLLGNITNTRAAQDATVVVNGVTVTSSSNSVTNAIDGVTLNLKTTNTGSTTPVTIASDAEAITTKINDFVKAYNDTITQLRKQSTFDTNSKTGGPLVGDSTVRNIISTLRSTVAQSISGLSGGVATLADVGITTAKDGTLSVDSTKLTTALNTPSKDVAGLFVKGSSTTGVASAIEALAKGYVDIEGIIAGRTDGLKSTIKNLDNEKSSLQIRLDAIQARYEAQFSALDTMISSMQTTSTYLAQQLARL